MDLRGEREWVARSFQSNDRGGYSEKHAWPTVPLTRTGLELGTTIIVLLLAAGRFIATIDIGLEYCRSSRTTTRLRSELGFYQTAIPSKPNLPIQFYPGPRLVGQVQRCIVPRIAQYSLDEELPRCNTNELS